MSDPTTSLSDGTETSPTGNESDPYGPPAGQLPVVVVSPDYAPAPEPTPPRSTAKKTWLVVAVIVAAVLAAVVAAVLVRWALTSAFGGPSKQDMIDKSVSQTKRQTDLPKQVDQITTWTDVKAEDGAIHYVYTISSGVDPSSVSEKALRDSIAPTLCSTKATRSILDHDIAMRYTYSFTGSTKTIDITYTKADC